MAYYHIAINSFLMDRLHFYKLIKSKLSAFSHVNCLFRPFKSISGSLSEKNVDLHTIKLN